MDIKNMRQQYLNTLTHPLDGMWENIIENATFFAITYHEQEIGYYCLDHKNSLLQFYLVDHFLNMASDIFKDLINSSLITKGYTYTMDPIYLNLSIEQHKSLSIHTNLFSDNERIEVVNNNLHIYKAKMNDVEQIYNFYRLNIDSSATWIRDYVKALLMNEQLFVLQGNETIIGV